MDTARTSSPRNSITIRMIASIVSAALLASMLALTACSSGAANSSEGETSSQPASTEADAQGAAQEAPAAAIDSAALVGEQTRKLQGALAPVATDTEMDVSITAIDLTTGATASIAGMNQHPAAGMIRLVVAAAYFDSEAAGVVSRTEQHTIADYEVVGGTGIYQDMVGETVTMGDVVFTMLAHGDNVATNIIIDRLGMYTIGSAIQKMGFTGTQLTTRMLDPESSRWSADNTMSSDDAASLLKQLYEGSLVSPEACAFMMDALRAQVDTQGIRTGLPEGTTFAHETGVSWNAHNDGGIVEGEHPYVIVALCSEHENDIDHEAALDLLARAGSASSSAVS